jgi:hypothetical protein
MYCGQCCVTEARLRAAPQLDIFIEILLRTRVNKGKKKNRSPRVRDSGCARFTGMC